MPDLNVNIKATDKTSKAFTAVKGNVNGLKGSFTKMMGPLTAIVGVAGLAGMARELLSVGDRMGKVSTQLGIGTGALQTYQFAAEQAGVSSNSMNTALQKLTRNIGEAKDGTLAQQEAFDALDVSLTNTDGSARDVESIFLDVSEAIKNTEDVTEKARIASDLFGRSGVDLLAVLGAGKQGFKDMGDELKSLGGIMSQEGIDNIQQFNDRMNALSKMGRGLFSDFIILVNGFISRIIRGIDKTKEWLSLMEEDKPILTIKELNKQIKDNGAEFKVLDKSWNTLNKRIIATEAGSVERAKVEEQLKTVMLVLETKKNAKFDETLALQIELNARQGKNLDLTKLVKKEQTTVTKEVEKQQKFYVLAADGVTKIGHVSKETLKTLELEGEAHNVLNKEQADMLTHAVALEKVELAKVAMAEKLKQEQIERNELLLKDFYIEQETLDAQTPKLKSLEEMDKILGEGIDKHTEELKLIEAKFDAIVKTTEQLEEFDAIEIPTLADKIWEGMQDGFDTFKTNMGRLKGVMDDAGISGFFSEFGGDIMKAGGKSGARMQGITDKLGKGDVMGAGMELILSNEKVQEALGKVFEAIFALVDPIIDLLAPVLDVLVEVIEELNPLLEILLPPIKALLAPIKTILTWFKALAGGISTLAGNLAGFSGSMGKMQEAWDKLKGAFEWYNKWLISLLGKDSFIVKGMDNLARPIRSLLGPIQNLINALDMGGSDSILSSPGTWLKNRTGISLGFQHGGFAVGGKPILVGEAGPEIFTPSAGGGMVTPNDEIGGQPIYITIVDGTGQVLQQYDSAIRVEINDRANRFGEFPALTYAS